MTPRTTPKNRMSVFMTSMLIFIATLTPVSLPFVEAASNTDEMSGNVSSFLAELRAKADSGDAQSQFKLGQLYLKGQEGVSKDYAKALYWYRLAAKQGNANAQNGLGSIYSTLDYDALFPLEKRKIIWMPKLNYAKALHWYRLAAKQGNAEAQNNLGNLYDNGQGVPQDYTKAAHWYRLAANQGNVWAQYNLGVLYYFGQGVPQDYEKSYKWLILAKAASGAQSTLASKLINRLMPQMTPDQIAEGQRFAREWTSARKQFRPYR